MTTPMPVQPITQDRARFRVLLPEWLRQFPRLRFPTPRRDFSLVSEADLRAVLQSERVNETVIEQLVAEVRAIDQEIMRLFRERDYEASKQQNRYRLYQLGYMFLATVATFIGSLQALSFGSNPRYVALFALLQTIIAGLTTFLSFISTREPPLMLWMNNRRAAEFLRREYFRYFAGLSPYNDMSQPAYVRRRELALRAARAARGEFPEELYLET